MGKMLLINNMRTSPYHPYCTGLDETINQTVIDIFCPDIARTVQMIVISGTDRDLGISQSSTELSPAQLVYWRLLRLYPWMY
jgi:hypothetical protein